MISPLAYVSSKHFVDAALSIPVAKTPADLVLDSELFGPCESLASAFRNQINLKITITLQ